MAVSHRLMSGPPDHDQRGFAFARVVGAHIDIGAFESGATSADFDIDGDIDGADFAIRHTAIASLFYNLDLPWLQCRQSLQCLLKDSEKGQAQSFLSRSPQIQGSTIATMTYVDSAIPEGGLFPRLCLSFSPYSFWYRLSLHYVQCLDRWPAQP